jgi:hypothetical protein
MTFMTLHRAAFSLPAILAVVCACSTTHKPTTASGAAGGAGTHDASTTGAGGGTAVAVDAADGAAGAGAGGNTGASGTGDGAAGSTDVTVEGAAGTGDGAAGSTDLRGASAACKSYCTIIMANCTGANQQYTDVEDCVNVCAFIPVGTPTDTGINSVGCKANVAAAAATDQTALKSHCFGAGPLSFGYCGEDCGLFCSVALSYCPGSYKSMDDCSNVCDQFARVIPDTTATPGIYNSMWNPGTDPTSDIKDTLECRAYHLFIEALQNTANQQMYCPDVANMSAACGSGVGPIVVPDAGTMGADVATIPTYDGSLVGGG